MAKFLISRKFSIDINIPVIPKGLTIIIGRNGSGKTTLLRLISGKHKMNKNEYESLIKTMEADSFSCFIEESTIPQNESIIKILEYFGCILKMNSKIVNDLVKTFDLSEIMKKPFFKCSEGERKKLLIILNLGQDNKSLYFLDEPSDNLDSKSRSNLVKLLSETFQEENILLVTHSPHDFIQIPHNLISIDN